MVRPGTVVLEGLGHLTGSRGQVDRPPGGGETGGMQVAGCVSIPSILILFFLLPRNQTLEQLRLLVALAPGIIACRPDAGCRIAARGWNDDVQDSDH